MRLCIALAGVMAVGAPASADEVTRYHNQVVATDLVALGLMFGGYKADETAVTGTGIGLGIGGAPIVHLAHGNIRGAAKSLLLRTTLPLATAWIGHKFEAGIQVCAVLDDGSRTGSGCQGTSGVGALWGFGIGVFAASVIDASKLASKVERSSWTPDVTIANGGMRVSIAGSF